MNTGYLHKYNLLFFGFNFTYFAAGCCYYGFLVRFLSSYGYSAFQCGVINMLLSCVALVVQPLSGYLCDTHIEVKKYLAVSTAVSAVLLFALPLTINIPVVPVIFTMLFAVFEKPVTFLADTWAVTLREEHSFIDYGKNRAGGSVGYTIAAAIGGVMIGKLGFWSIFILAFAMKVLNFLCVLPIPGIPCRNVKVHPHKEASSRSFGSIVKTLLHNRSYMLFMASAFFYSISINGLASNATFKILDVGGGDTEIGIALALSAIFEVPALFCINLIVRRFKVNSAYTVALLVMLVRNLFYLFSASPGGFYVSMALQALANGVYIAVPLELINRILPSEIRATSAMILTAVTAGGACIIANLLFGYIVDAAGVFAMGIVGMLALVISIVIQFYQVIYLHKHDMENYI